MSLVDDRLRIVAFWPITSVVCFNEMRNYFCKNRFFCSNFVSITHFIIKTFDISIVLMKHYVIDIFVRFVVKL